MLQVLSLETFLAVIFERYQLSQPLATLGESGEQNLKNQKEELSLMNLQVQQSSPYLCIKCIAFFLELTNF